MHAQQVRQGVSRITVYWLYYYIIFNNCYMDHEPAEMRTLRSHKHEHIYLDLRGQIIHILAIISTIGKYDIRAAGGDDPFNTLSKRHYTPQSTDITNPGL